MGFTKHDEDKAPLFELSTYQEGTLEAEARVLAYGAAKYGRDNWHQAEKTEAIERYSAAAMRHLLAILRGEWTDDETGQTHAAHLRCCAGFLHFFTEWQADEDDEDIANYLARLDGEIDDAMRDIIEATETVPTTLVVNPPLGGRVAGQCVPEFYDAYYQYNGTEVITHCAECLEPIKRNQLYMSDDGVDFCCITCQKEWTP